MPEPWEVADVDLAPAARSVLVTVGLRDAATLACAECGQTWPGYGTRPRRWRHVDTWRFQTILEADVPRVVSRARREADSRAVCRSRRPLHGPVRTARHRLDDRGRPIGDSPADRPVAGRGR